MKMETYPLKQGLLKLVLDITAKWAVAGVESVFSKEKPQKIIVVAVAGGSATGKTSHVAQWAADKFNGLLLSMDDYYKGRALMEAEAKNGILLNWDQPEALNLELLKQHLRALKVGQAINKPVYSFKTGEVEGFNQIQPKNLIVVEGLFALHPLLLEEADIKVFVDVGFHGRVLRRLLRDVERTGQRPKDILRMFTEVVEPMHEQYVLPTKEHADFIITNEFSPVIEAERSGLHERQMKAKLEAVDTEAALRVLKAERLAVVAQIDRYYSPKNRDLSRTGEMLRIREEGSQRIFTYKGPQLSSKFRKRAKLEFLIDSDLAEGFIDLYGVEIKVVKKLREMYSYQGLIFSLDSVWAIGNGQTRTVGDFLEIRLPDINEETTIPAPALEDVEKAFGLVRGNFFCEAYVEM